MLIEYLQPKHITQLCYLVNDHVSTLLPGWGLPPDVIAASLLHNEGEHVMDSWVRERHALVVMDGTRLVAATHLLRYGDGGSVGRLYRRAADIAWLLYWPDSREAALMLMSAAQQFMQD